MKGAGSAATTPQSAATKRRDRRKYRGQGSRHQPNPVDKALGTSAMSHHWVRPMCLAMSTTEPDVSQLRRSSLEPQSARTCAKVASTVPLTADLLAATVIGQVDLVKDLDTGGDLGEEEECALCCEPVSTSILALQPVWGCIWCQ
eukprot:2308203-Pyramimonas_sp.AAC.2